MTNTDNSTTTPPLSNDDIFMKLLTARLNIFQLFDHVQTLVRRVDRLEEAYYEAHPDRKAKDHEIERQLNELNYKRSPDSPTEQK